jgi:hypothetical protein
VQFQLFLGRNIPDAGTISKAMMQTFIREEVCPRFDGFTVTEGVGFWKHVKAVEFMEDTFGGLRVHPSGQRPRGKFLVQAQDKFAVVLASESAAHLVGRGTYGRHVPGAPVILHVAAWLQAHGSERLVQGTVAGEAHLAVQPGHVREAAARAEDPPRLAERAPA